jgi:hypothetical protein
LYANAISNNTYINTIIGSTFIGNGIAGNGNASVGGCGLYAYAYNNININTISGSTFTGTGSIGSGEDSSPGCGLYAYAFSDAGTIILGTTIGSIANNDFTGSTDVGIWLFRDNTTLPITMNGNTSVYNADDARAALSGWDNLFEPEPHDIEINE